MLRSLDAVVCRAHEQGIYVQATWARDFAAEVACAASLGLITTRNPESFGRIWRPTARGLCFMYEGEL